MSDDDTQAKAEPIKICEALVDPPLGWGTANLDGQEMCHLRVTHPRLGPIDCLLFKATARALIAGLADAVGVVEADKPTGPAH